MAGGTNTGSPRRALSRGDLMICGPCRDGADLLTPAPALPAAALAIARQMHEQCKDCTCQHRMPTVEELTARRSELPGGGLYRIANVY